MCDSDCLWNVFILSCCGSRFCWHVLVYAHWWALNLWKIFTKNLSALGTRGHAVRAGQHGPVGPVSTPSSTLAMTAYQWEDWNDTASFKTKTDASKTTKWLGREGREWRAGTVGLPGSWPEAEGCPAPPHLQAGRWEKEPGSPLEGRRGSEINPFPCLISITVTGGWEVGNFWRPQCY